MRLGTYRSEYETARLVNRGPSLEPPDEPDFEDEIETELDRLCAIKHVVSDAIGDSEELVSLSFSVDSACVHYAQYQTEVAQECLQRAAIELGNAVRNYLRPRAEKRVYELARYFGRGEPE
jgi:hypothetical protein